MARVRQGHGLADGPAAQHSRFDVTRCSLQDRLRLREGGAYQYCTPATIPISSLLTVRIKSLLAGAVLSAHMLRRRVADAPEAMVPMGSAGVT